MVSRLLVGTVGTALSFAGAIVCQTISPSELASRLQANSSISSDYNSGPDLLQLMQRSGKDLTRTLVVNENNAVCNDCASVDATNNPSVRQAAAESDLVVVARDLENNSAFTKGNRFLITDSEMVVLEVWKKSTDNAAVNGVSVNSEITVVSSGGNLTVAGQHLSVSLSNRKPFEAGHQYLLFLHYRPGTNSYVKDHFSGFDISGSTVLPLHTTGTHPNQKDFPDSRIFLSNMQQSVYRTLNGEHE